MRPNRLLLSLAVAALAAGCSGKLKLRTDYDASHDFTSLRTYAWLLAPATSPRDPRLANKEIDARIRRVVDEELAARGYEKATGDSPDFFVKYHAALEGSLDTTMLDSSYGAGPGWTYGGGWDWTPGMTGSYVKKYRKGALVIDVVDDDRETLIWRGSATAKVTTDSSPEEREERLHNAVGPLLDRFPPLRSAPSPSAGGA